MCNNCSLFLSQVQPQPASATKSITDTVTSSVSQNVQASSDLPRSSEVAMETNVVDENLEDLTTESHSPSNTTVIDDKVFL